MPRSRRSSSVSRNARRPTPISARPSIQSNADALQSNVREPTRPTVTTIYQETRNLSELFGSSEPQRPTGAETLSSLRPSSRATIAESSLSTRPTAGRPTAMLLSSQDIPRIYISFSGYIHSSLGRPRPRPTLDLSEEVTHVAPMTPQQIKQSIQSRPDTNQDIKFMEKKKCGVCLGSWKEILMEGKHLVFTECGHIFCRDCATRFASEGRRECPLCKKSLVGVCPPFRRLHLPLDPRLKKNRAD